MPDAFIDALGHDASALSLRRVIRSAWIHCGLNEPAPFLAKHRTIDAPCKDRLTRRTLMSTDAPKQAIPKA